MEEREHLVSILEQTKEGLKNKNAYSLSGLSNQTIHHASLHQDEGCITLAVLIYTLSKIIERKDYEKIPSWEKFNRKFIGYVDLTVMAINSNNDEKYIKYLEMLRKLITGMSVNIKPYVQEVLRKASINKASKIYEHGISMGRTAKMLGITQWELTEYTGQKGSSDNEYNQSLNIKKRAQMALEFFS
jgi:hypothetical protein